MSFKDMSIEGQKFYKAQSILIDAGEIGNNNGKLDTNAEEKRMNSIMSDAVASGVLSAEDALLLKDAFVSEESGETDNNIQNAAKGRVSNPMEGSSTKPEELSKKHAKSNKRDIKNDLDDWANDNQTTLSTLPEVMEEKYRDSHTQNVQDVNTVIGKMEYDSKKDVEALEKNLRKQGNLTQDQKQLVPDLVKLAEKDQIVKEANVLVDAGLEIKTEMEKENEGKDKPINYTDLQTAIKEKSDEVYTQKGDKSYKQQAEAIVDSRLKDAVSEDVTERLSTKDYQIGALLDEIAELEEDSKANPDNKAENDKKIADDTARIAKLKNCTAEEIRKELKEYFKDDAFSANVIDDEKNNKTNNAINLITRMNTFLGRKEDLKNVSVAEIEKAFNGNLLIKVKDYILTKERKNEDGTYNLSDISDIVEYRSGFDYRTNISEDPQYSELENIKLDLHTACGSGLELTDGEVKKILDFVKMEYAHRETLSAKEALKAEDYAKDATMGTLANLPGIHYVSQRQVITAMSDSEFNAVLNVLKENPKATIEDASKVLSDASQTVFDGIIGPAIGGAAVSIIVGLLWDMIIGDLPDEKACANLVDDLASAIKYENDPQGYKEYLATRNYVPNALKNINKLIDIYTKDNKFNVVEFLTYVNEAQGPGSKLNCQEILGRVLKAHTPEKQETTIHQEDGSIIVYGKDPEPITKEEELPKEQGKTWVGHTYEYECLRKAFDNVEIRQNGKKLGTDAKAARALKIIQAIRPDKMDNYLNNETEIVRLVRQSFERPSAMMNETDIIYGTYNKALGDDVVGMVYLPQFLLCERNSQNYQAQNYKTTGTKRFDNTSTYTHTITVAMTDGKGAVKVNGVVVEKTTSLATAEAAAEKYKIDHPEFKNVEIQIVSEEEFNK